MKTCAVILRTRAECGQPAVAQVRHAQRHLEFCVCAGHKQAYEGSQFWTVRP